MPSLNSANCPNLWQTSPTSSSSSSGGGLLAKNTTGYGRFLTLYLFNGAENDISVSIFNLRSND